jgi:uncharacterized protein YcfJ
MNERDRLLTDTEPDATPDERLDVDGPGAGTAGGAVGGAVSGAIAGTLIGGPVGTAVGAAVGAVGGAALGYAADETSEDNDTPDNTADAPAAGIAGGVTPVSPGAAMHAGAATIGVGGLGLPTAASDAEIEREGVERGPYDHPAAYDETAAKVAKERPILVSDDPGYEAVDTGADAKHTNPPSRVYIRDRDDIAQGGEPR